MRAQDTNLSLSSSSKWQLCLMSSLCSMYTISILPFCSEILKEAAADDKDILKAVAASR